MAAFACVIHSCHEIVDRLLCAFRPRSCLCGSVVSLHDIGLQCACPCGTCDIDLDHPFADSDEQSGDYDTGSPSCFVDIDFDDDSWHDPKAIRILKFIRRRQSFATTKTSYRFGQIHSSMSKTLPAADGALQRP